MDLTTYLREVGERPAAFARRIGVAHSTLSGWLRDPRRGPSRASLAAIERATGGKVTAKDFAPPEDTGHSLISSGAHNGDIPPAAQPAGAD